MIGTYPRFSLSISMLLSLMTYGMVEITFRDSIREGYTALDARSRYETQALREFLNMLNDPMEMAVMMLARDGGSMHRKAHLDEADRIVDTISNLTIKYKDQKLIYNELCSPYCFTNELFKTFKRYFDVNYRSAVKNHYYSDLYNLSYPFASIWGYRVPIEQCLYGVRLVDSSKPSSNESTGAKRFFFDDNKIKVNPNMPIESQITNMEHVSLIAIFLYGNKNTTERNIALSKWELGIHEFTKRYNKGQINRSSLVEVYVKGNRILDMEVSEDNRKISPYFSTGFALMFSTVVICLFSSSYYHNAIDFGKILVGLAAILCPLLAITSTFGLLTLFASRINSLLLVMPFLIMGIGVDSSFLMIHSWVKMAGQNCDAASRLGRMFFQTLFKNQCLLPITMKTSVYEESGPSITISSMTNVLSFGIGAITPTPGKFITIVLSTIWREHLSPVLLVNNRFDITDINLTTQFWNTLKELESPASSYVWLRAFAQKYNRTKDDYPYNVSVE
ncbi:hypothetical protein Angca_008269, partial [Angiostrongylus cantonensis]